MEQLNPNVQQNDDTGIKSSDNNQGKIYLN